MARGKAVFLFDRESGTGYSGNQEVNDMKSIMELLVGKVHPEYNEDEIWQEIWQYCEKNARKIELFIKWYQIPSKTEAFAEKREKILEMICNMPDRELQRMLRMIDNFDLAMLFLLADAPTEEHLRNNISRRLEFIIGGEAYTIVKKINPDEEQFDGVLDKIVKMYFSEEMLQFRREEWERRNRFKIDQSLSKKQKEWKIYNQVPIAAIAHWNKPYEQQKPTIVSFLCDDYENEWLQKISNLFWDHCYQEALEEAFKFSDAGKGQVSFTLSGLEFDEEYNIIFSTYLIRQRKEKKVIYHFMHQVEYYPEIEEVIMDGNNLKEVAEEEFLRFCYSVYEYQYS